MQFFTKTRAGSILQRLGPDLVSRSAESGLTIQAEVPECSQLMGSIIESTCGRKLFHAIVKTLYTNVDSDDQRRFGHVLCRADIPFGGGDPCRDVLSTGKPHAQPRARLLKLSGNVVPGC